MNVTRYGSDHRVRARIQLDQPVPLRFPAGDRVWIPTWVNAQTFLTPFRPEYGEMVHGGIIGKASSFLYKKSDFNFSS